MISEAGGMCLPCGWGSAVLVREMVWMLSGCGCGKLEICLERVSGGFSPFSRFLLMVVKVLIEGRAAGVGL